MYNTWLADFDDDIDREFRERRKRARRASFGMAQSEEPEVRIWIFGMMGWGRSHGFRCMCAKLLDCITQQFSMHVSVVWKQHASTCITQADCIALHPASCCSTWGQYSCMCML